MHVVRIKIRMKEKCALDNVDYFYSRLKAVELTLNHYEEATQVVSSVELQLVSMEEMPSDVESAARYEENLRVRHFFI